MADSLHDTTWILVGPVLAPAGVDVVIAFADGAVSGFSGCNRFRGSYLTTGDGLQFGPLAGTMMACSDDAMAIEREVLRRLGTTVRASASASGEALLLLGVGDEVLLEFRAQHADELAGDWVVTGIHYPARQAIISTRGEPTVIIGDGAITGDAGCNQFRGSCSITDDVIAIGPLIATRKFCDDDPGDGPSIMEQEAALLAALQDATGFRLEGSRLTLTRADGGISVSLHRARP